MVIGILGGMFVIIIVYIYLMFAKPSIDTNRDETEKLTTQIDANKAKIAEFEAFLADETRKQEVEALFAALTRRLPSDPDPFRVFDLLRDAFDGTGVNFTRLEPTESKSYGPLSYHPFKISGSARYHEFGQLVNFVECNPERLMRVATLTLRNSNSRPSIHPMEIGIGTFTLNQ